MISKAQFIFSLSFSGENSGVLKQIWADDGGQRTSRWKAKGVMFIDPIITLWNPYDVPMDVSEFRIYLYRLPLEFKFSNINRAHSVPPSKYSDFSWQIDFARINWFI